MHTQKQSSQVDGQNRPTEIRLVDDVSKLQTVQFLIMFSIHLGWIFGVQKTWVYHCILFFCR